MFVHLKSWSTQVFRTSCSVHLTLISSLAPLFVPSQSPAHIIIDPSSFWTTRGRVPQHCHVDRTQSGICFSVSFVLTRMQWLVCS